VAVAGLVGQREMQEGELPGRPAEFGPQLADQASVIGVDCESVNLGPSVILADPIFGAVGVPAALVQRELLLRGNTAVDPPRSWTTSNMDAT